MKCKKCGDKVKFNKTSSEKGHALFWVNNKIVAIDSICKDCYDGDH